VNDILYTTGIVDSAGSGAKSKLITCQWQLAMQKPRAAVAWDDICLSQRQHTLGNTTVDSLLPFVLSAPLNNICTWSGFA